MRGPCRPGLIAHRNALSWSRINRDQPWRYAALLRMLAWLSTPQSWQSMAAVIFGDQFLLRIGVFTLKQAGFYEAAQTSWVADAVSHLMKIATEELIARSDFIWMRHPDGIP